MRGRLVFFGLLATVLTLPLQWVSLATVLGLNLRLFHLAAALTVVGVVTHPDYRATLRRILPSVGWIVVPYAFLLWWSAGSLIWSPTDLEQAVGILLKSLAYAGFFVIYAIAFALIDARRLRWVVLLGGGGGVLIFLLVASAIFASLGRNFLVEYLAAFISGRAAELQFAFYPIIFNYDFSAGYTATGASEAIGTALRNTMVGGFVMVFFLSRAFGSDPREGGPSRRPPALDRGLFSIISLTTLALIVLSVSRSNLIVVVIGALVAWLLKSGRSLRVVLGGAWMMVIAVAILAGTASLWIDPLVEGWAVIYERLDALFVDSRMAMYDRSMDGINSAPWLGHGLGAEVRFLGDQELRVHNLFLASWYETGVIGAAIALAFYMSTVTALVRVALRDRPREGGWIPMDGPAWRWIVVLPFLPLFRSLISGAGGHFTFIEWLSLSVFLGVLTRREMMRESETDSLEPEPYHLSSSAASDHGNAHAPE